MLRIHFLAGFVPRAFSNLFPNASVVRSHVKVPYTDSHLYLVQVWNNFPAQYCCVDLLNPKDPLFQEVGKRFIKQLIQDFGTDHYYNADTFNEMVPSSNDSQYLADTGFVSLIAPLIRLAAKLCLLASLQVILMQYGSCRYLFQETAQIRRVGCFTMNHGSGKNP